MSRPQEMNVKDQGPLSDASKGIQFGELIRDYEAVPGVQWRFGKPNYERVNKLYFQHRTKRHAQGSLEDVVNKLVKNWEVESHHIANPHQWKTMDIKSFTAQVNGGCPANSQLLADIGPYNLLIGDTYEYSASKLTYEESNANFGATFADGYAWECLEVLSGPPMVTFKWRHFGKYSGTFTDKNGLKHKGTGEMLNLIGLCVAKVNSSLVIESLDIYYNPSDLLIPLMAGKVDGDTRVIRGDETDRKPKATTLC